MKEFFTKFFKDKKNIVITILIGCSIVTALIASIPALDFFMPISCIFFGLTCIYGSYMFLLFYVKIKNKRTDEFLSEDERFKKKKSKFLESENKINIMLLTGLFFVMGLILIYYGISVFVA